MTKKKSPEIHLRVNQVGYLPDDRKIAIAFSGQSLESFQFELIDDSSGVVVWGPKSAGRSAGAFGNFAHHHYLDFTPVKESRRVRVRMAGMDTESEPFNIGAEVYDELPEIALSYIRQQRCGYNPFLDEVCHPRDGRTVYGPMPDSTYIDATGGWHDAGDYLRYLLTSGNTVCRLLFAYRENRGKYDDGYDALGHPGPNGIPDVLDEARWGLQWMLKMHPAEDQLFHQVADDRDHIGFKLPHADSADYGWGPGSYRVVYYATGGPQGLGKYQNTSTGIANLAGRYAAAMAMAAGIWADDLDDPHFAATCLKAGREVFQMGLSQPGCQEGTPCLAPYRYYESTWADDMEWGAAELHRVTGELEYLEYARQFSRLIGSTSWMGLDTARHYEFYPFMNIGHYSLFEFADPPLQDSLIHYFRENLEAIVEKAKQNPYSIGVPFIWCSNNLASALINQCLLYERMSGDSTYREIMLAHRDWLLGRNPWGVTQFVAVPLKDGISPQYPHSAITLELGIPVRGGLLDGPVYTSIFKALKGIRLFTEDRYAPFQSDVVVYHDDIGDYSTNEPTLDGTAEAFVFLSFFDQTIK